MSVCLRHRPAAKTEGFSLIEVALGLVVIGLLIGPVIHLYTIYAAQKPWGDTTGNVGLTASAISNFYLNNGHYPCPADLTLPRTNPNYGMEDRNPGSGKCNIALSPPGCSVATGECRANNGYDTTNDLVANPDNVLIGAVPVASLGLTTNDGLDGYKNKLTYMVSEILTETATFDMVRGGIIARNIEYDTPSDTDYDMADGADIIPQTPPPDRGAHYAILSHGVDGNGAFSADGFLVSACGLLAAARDNENCNNDAIITVDNDGQDINMGNTPAYFDDYATYATSFGYGYWSVTPGATDIMNTNLQNVGINNGTPTERLDVKGNIRAQSGAESSNLCDTSAANCFDPKVIGGSTGDISCPPGQTMTAIAGGVAVCSNFTFATALPVNQSCLLSPLGAYVIGIRANGNVICGP